MKFASGGRLCIPPEHWRRNILQYPPNVAEFSAYFQQSFVDGSPWCTMLASFSVARQRWCQSPFLSRFANFLGRTLRFALFSVRMTHWLIDLSRD